MSVMVLQLTSGTELLANVEESDDMVIMKKPYQLIFSPEGVGLMPFMPLASCDDIPVNKNHVVVMVEADENAKNVYTQQTTNLIIPTANPNLKLTD